MKLWIAAETGLKRRVQHRSSLTGPVDFEEALDPLAVAKIHHCKAGLLLEEATQASRAQTGTLRQLIQAQGRSILVYQACSFLDRRMDVAHGDIRRPLKALPCVQQRIAQAGVEQRRATLRPGKLVEQLL